MVIKGPLGILPRPASREQLTIIASEDGVLADFSVRGPLGGPRPFARSNPGMDEDEIEEVKQTAERNMEE